MTDADKRTAKRQRVAKVYDLLADEQWHSTTELNNVVVGEPRARVGSVSFV